MGGIRRIAVRAFRAAAVVLIAGIFAAPVQASVEDDAGDFVQSFGDKAIGLMQQTAPTGDARRDRFRQLLVEILDIQKVSHAALGRYRRQATDVQLARYQTAYLDYILSVYTGMFRAYDGETLAVKRIRPLPGGDFLVDGVMLRKVAAPVRLAFRLRYGDGRFRLLDVYVEGISMLLTQRSEFASVIRNEGMDGLLTRLRQVTTRQPPD